MSHTAEVLQLITPQEDYVQIDYTDKPEEEQKERRTKFTQLARPRFKEIIQWIAEGQTDYSIAQKIGVHYNTFSSWKTEYNELADLYARAQDARNCLTMNSAFKRANGIRVHLKKQKVLTDGSVKDYIEEQYYPPDVPAMDLYFRNNMPDYKGPKDAGTIQITQNNFQLPEAKAKVADMLQEYKGLIELGVGEFQVVED